LRGVELRLTAGHTPGHEMLIFRAGELACVMTGDLISVQPHLRVGWNNSADLDVLRVLKEKARLLDEASHRRWLLVLGHETEQPAGYVDQDSTWTPEPALAPAQASTE
jgi:glyoxylase-like metal-dependent hydrolase (beta-lactamase superfamily II)